MYKLIGAVILVLAALFCSAYILLREKKHIEQLGGFTELIRQIYKQIEAFNLPVPDIMKSLDRDILKSCGASGQEGLTIESLVSREELFLNQKEKKIILDFSQGLGRCYRDEQLKLCKYYLDELEGRLSIIRSEYPKKRKLTLTLCFCAALGLIILMI